MRKLPVAESVEAFCGTDELQLVRCGLQYGADVFVLKDFRSFQGAETSTLMAYEYSVPVYEDVEVFVYYGGYADFVVRYYALAVLFPENVDSVILSKI